MAPDPQPSCETAPGEAHPDAAAAAATAPGPANTDGGATPAAKGDATTFLSVFLATFSTVFLAELGDKTQLAALLLSAESGRPLIVFCGASLALICSSLVGVLLGRWLARFIPAQLLERLAGILMVALGLWLGRQAVLSFLPDPGLAMGTPPPLAIAPPLAVVLPPGLALRLLGLP